MVKKMWLAVRELFSDQTHQEAMSAIYRWFYEEGKTWKK